MLFYLAQNLGQAEALSCSDPFGRSRPC